MIKLLLYIINELKKFDKDAIHISKFEDIKNYLKSKVEIDDIVLTLGAGNITKLADLLVNENE